MREIAVVDGKLSREGSIHDELGGSILFVAGQVAIKRKSLAGVGAARIYGDNDKADNAVVFGSKIDLDAQPIAFRELLAGQGLEAKVVPGALGREIEALHERRIGSPGIGTDRNIGPRINRSGFTHINVQVRSARHDAVAISSPAILDGRCVKIVVGDNLGSRIRVDQRTDRDIENRIGRRDAEPAETGIQGIDLHHIDDGSIGFQDNINGIVVGFWSIDIKIDIAAGIGRQSVRILLDLDTFIQRVQIEPSRGLDARI